MTTTESTESTLSSAEAGNQLPVIYGRTALLLDLSTEESTADSSDPLCVIARMAYQACEDVTVFYVLGDSGNDVFQALSDFDQTIRISASSEVSPARESDGFDLEL